MSALTWLNDLVQWLGRWVPRLVLIQPTHRGVRFGPRGAAVEVGPGLVLYWPITHALFEVPVTTQSVQLPAQVLPLGGEDAALFPRVLLCASAIQFRVDDVVLAATKALNLHALVDNRTQAAIARHISAKDDLLAWSRLVTEDLSRDLTPFGVVIERLDFTQHGVGCALKNIADWSYQEAQDGRRPS